MVIGVGPGLGAAISRRLAHGGFSVALIARNNQFIETLANELSATGHAAIAIAADASHPAEIANAVARVRAELGPIEVLIYNASSASGNGLLGTKAEEFEATWRITTLGAFAAAREIAPDMIAARKGAMVFTGATSSVRGGGWLAFSSAKFALRGLAQALARELWPQGVHVAHVIVDGLIGERGCARADAAEPALDPEQMAEAYFQLVEQDRSAWTLELDLRPHQEKFFE